MTCVKGLSKNMKHTNYDSQSSNWGSNWEPPEAQPLWESGQYKLYGL